MYQYSTRDAGKATALFCALAQAGFPTQLNALVCKDHGHEGSVITTNADAAEFKIIRASISEKFPSTAEAVKDMPTDITVPDHLPEDFS